jgi:hypothetical protein
MLAGAIAGVLAVAVAIAIAVAVEVIRRTSSAQAGQRCR